MAREFQMRNGRLVPVDELESCDQDGPDEDKADE